MSSKIAGISSFLCFFSTLKRNQTTSVIVENKEYNNTNKSLVSQFCNSSYQGSGDWSWYPGKERLPDIFHSCKWSITLLEWHLVKKWGLMPKLIVTDWIYYSVRGDVIIWYLFLCHGHCVWMKRLTCKKCGTCCCGDWNNDL